MGWRGTSGVAPATIHAVAERNRAPGEWSWSSMAIAVVGLLAFVLVSRSVVALAFGRAPSDYLPDVFLGAGLWLPAMIGAAALAAVAAFDRAAHPRAGLDTAASLRTTFAVGLALVYQGLWVVYTLQLR